MDVTELKNDIDSITEQLCNMVENNNSKPNNKNSNHDKNH